MSTPKHIKDILPGVMSSLERYRANNPPGSIDRGAVCPDATCDSAATVVGEQRHCQQCGKVWQRTGKQWGVVDECKRFNGSFGA